jgi:undecaprenyl-diphosphatase
LSSGKGDTGEVTPPLALSLVERIVQWVEPAFLVAGYVIIAGGVLLERSVFIGLIVPGDVILALGGVYASQGKLNLMAVIVVGTLAAIAGESIGFWLGHRYGAGMIRHVPLIGRFMAERLEDAQEFFKRNGGKTVAIGRYATAAGAFIPFTAGVARMPYRRFIAFDAPAIAVWATGITIFGYAFGKNLAFIDKVLSRFGLIVLGLLAVILLGRWLWKRVRGRRDSPR